MKKVALVAVAVGLAVSAMSAQAVEVTVGAGQDYSDWDKSVVSFAVAKDVKAPVVGDVKASVEYTNLRNNGSGYDQYAIVGTKQVAKVGPVDLGVRAGLAYVDQKDAGNGFAGIVGVGASLPVTKTVAVVGGVDYRVGEQSLSAGDGWTGRLGVRVSF